MICGNIPRTPAPVRSRQLAVVVFWRGPRHILQLPRFYGCGGGIPRVQKAIVVTSPLTWNFSSQASNFLRSSVALSLSSLLVPALSNFSSFSVNFSDNFEAEEPPTRVEIEEL